MMSNATQRYQSPDRRWVIELPPTWEQVDDHPVAWLAAREPSRDDGLFRANVNVVIEAIEQPMTNQDVLARERDALIEAADAALLIDSQEFDAGPVLGEAVIATTAVDDSRVTVIQRVARLDDTSILVLTAMVETIEFDVRRGEIEAVVSSLEVHSD